MERDPDSSRSASLTQATDVPRSLRSNDSNGNRGSFCAAQGILSRAVPEVPTSPITGEAAPRERAGEFLRSSIFGLISSITLVPLMITFTSTSSLKFACGQVQDAGLIFLSAMAAKCVHSVNNDDPIEVVSTTLVTLALATALLGAGLVLIAVFRLASYVQYLPQPVVSGYLAFIGLFCGQAGLVLMAATPIDNISQWTKLFHWNLILRCLPGVLGGVAIYVALRQSRHFAVLPSMLISIPVLFFIVLFIAGSSIEEARETGWVDDDTSQVQFWHMWQLFDLTKVQWGTMVQQLPTWFEMFFLVAFSSCLDVAAIQLDLGKNLDFNHELRTVGISNFVSGITGGFAGSYIFSQTCFAMRSGVNSQVFGVAIVICETVIFLLPFSILAYIPRLFFGSILAFIAVDLIVEHLFEAYHKTTLGSFVIAWTTFIAINVFGIMLGMLIGICVTGLHFLIKYARFGQTTRRLNARSRVFRDSEQLKLLEQHSHEIVAIEISGHIFFGSALKLLEDIKRQVLVPALPETRDRSDSSASAAELKSLSRSVSVLSVATMPTSRQTSFVVLDFRWVTGMDITAAGSCFKPLRQELGDHGIILLLTNLETDTRRILEYQGITLKDVRPEDDDLERGVTHEVRVFERLDKGIEWCERILLERQGASPRASPSSRSNGLARTLVNSINSAPVARSLLFASLDDHGKRLLAVEKYFVRLEFTKGSNVFSIGDMSDAIFVIESGVVSLQSSKCTQQYDHGGVLGDLDFFLQQPRSLTASAVTDCAIWKLPQENFSRLALEHPDQLASLQLAMQCLRLCY